MISIISSIGPKEEPRRLNVNKKLPVIQENRRECAKQSNLNCERDSEIKSGSESGTKNESCSARREIESGSESGTRNESFSARGEIERAVRSAAVANLCDIESEIVAFLDHEGVEHKVKLFQLFVQHFHD